MPLREGDDLKKLRQQITQQLIKLHREFYFLKLRALVPLLRISDNNLLLICQLTNQFRNQGCPPCLMAGAQAAAGISIKIFEE